jgi:hypothetical protein
MLAINTGNIHTKREWTGAMTRFRSAVAFIANYRLDWCVHTVSLNYFSCRKLHTGRFHNAWNPFHLHASRARNSVTKLISFVNKEWFSV